MNQHSTAVIVLCCVLSPVSMAAEHAVAKVVIRSSWAGWGVAPETNIIIEADAGGYRRGRDQIEPRLVDALVSATQEGPLPQPDSLNLGVTEAWLKTKAPSLTASDLSWDAATPSQKQLFISSFSDIATVKAVLPSLYNFIRMDDYPSVQVEVGYVDGSTVSVSS